MIGTANNETETTVYSIIKKYCFQILQYFSPKSTAIPHAIIAITVVMVLDFSWAIRFRSVFRKNALSVLVSYMTQLKSGMAANANILEYRPARSSYDTIT